MNNQIKVALVQNTCSADIEANQLCSMDAIRQAADKGAELILLQELHNSLYFCQTENAQNFDLAEPIPGPSTENFGEMAKALGIVIVTSLFERRASGLYHNTAAVLDSDGTVAGIYRRPS